MKPLKDRIYLLLKWSEKYTNTDMIYLTKGGGWLLLGHLMLLVTGLLTVIAFANLLPKEVYGTYQFIISIGAIISVFTLSGMGSSLTASSARGNDGSLIHGIKKQLKWSILMIIIGSALSVYYYVNGNSLLSISIFIVTFLSPFVEAFELTRSYLIGKKYFKDNTLFISIKRVLMFISILIAIYSTENIIIIITVFYLSSLISSAFLFFYIVSKYNLKECEDEKMVEYSKHLSVMRTFATIAGQSDKILIFHYLGSVPVAIYTIALMPVNHIEGLFSLFYSLTFSKISTTNIKRLKEVLPSKLKMLHYASLLIVVSYILLAPFIYKTIFPGYLESIIISQILMLTILTKPNLLYKQAFIAHGLKNQLYKLVISTDVIRILLLIILIPLFGIWGLVGAVLFSNTYHDLLVRYQFRKLKIL